MKYVAYYRVSTQKQKSFGHGLDGQKTAVTDFIASRNGELVQPPYVETESGKRNDRPELRKAIRACKKHKATLLVASIDRLTRNVGFLETLRDSGVAFVAVDMPDATNLTINILVAVAQDERERTSRRTKKALAEAKAKGVKLGNPNPSSDTSKARTANKANAAERRTKYGPMIRDLAAQGLSLRKIAAELEEREIESPRGKVEWSASMVKNLMP